MMSLFLHFSSMPVYVFLACCSPHLAALCNIVHYPIYKIEIVWCQVSTPKGRLTLTIVDFVYYCLQ